MPDAGLVSDYNRFMYVRGRVLNANDPTGHAVKPFCPNSNCEPTTLLDYSSVPGPVSEIIDPIVWLACGFLGCVADTKNDIIRTPTAQESANTVVLLGVNPIESELGAMFVDPVTNWEFNPKVDVDWRGTGKGVGEAIDEAFSRTGVSKEEFGVTKWAEDAYGKSHPVEWTVTSGDNKGAQVNVDWPHSKNGPSVPHVGYQTAGKRGAGGAVRGHILLDDVPYNR